MPWETEKRDRQADRPIDRVDLLRSAVGISDAAIILMAFIYSDGSVRFRELTHSSGIYSKNGGYRVEGADPGIHIWGANPSHWIGVDLLRSAGENRANAELHAALRHLEAPIGFRYLQYTWGPAGGWGSVWETDKLNTQADRPRGGCVCCGRGTGSDLKSSHYWIFAIWSISSASGIVRTYWIHWMDGEAPGRDT